MSFGYGRRASDFPKQRLITGLFYYLALSILAASLLTALYWQLEPDNAQFDYVEITHLSTPETRSFYVPVNFCAKTKGQEFTVIRAYHDIDRNIWYAVPDGKYKTGAGGCFDTRIQAHTGRLDPGNYMYHVSVSYQLNPLRTIQLKIAVVTVEIH
jgi:hypothetical protein